MASAIVRMNEWQNEATRALVLYSTPSEIKLTDQFYYHTTPSHLFSSTIPTEHSHTALGRQEEALRKSDPTPEGKWIPEPLSPLEQAYTHSFKPALFKRQRMVTVCITQEWVHGSWSAVRSFFRS
jgi:hypothetical protein